MNTDCYHLAESLGRLLEERNHTLTTVESCTGGRIAQTITSVAGSSAWFNQGLVTYSNQAKQRLVSVSTDLLDIFGAVSEQVVLAMAIGGRYSASADIAIAVSGIAGPTGGTKEKPVGTVCFAWVWPDESTVTTSIVFSGNRVQIQQAATQFALERVLDHLKQ